MVGVPLLARSTRRAASPPGARVHVSTKLTQGNCFKKLMVTFWQTESRNRACKHERRFNGLVCTYSKHKPLPLNIRNVGQHSTLNPYSWPNMVA